MIINSFDIVNKLSQVVGKTAAFLDKGDSNSPLINKIVGLVKRLGFYEPEQKTQNTPIVPDINSRIKSTRKEIALLEPQLPKYSKTILEQIQKGIPEDKIPERQSSITVTNQLDLARRKLEKLENELLEEQKLKDSNKV